MQLEPGVLENRLVRLEPLADRHREGLRAACDADPELWERLYSFAMHGAHFEAGWAWLTGEVAAGRAIAFAVMTEGRCRGMTSFLAIEAPHAKAEIGATYYEPSARGGPVNPAAKRLLLDHAFAAGARRIYLHVDALNARSRAAVLKLGAVQEGMLRHDRVVWTGRIRDTVVFSVLAGEWPKVRAGLDARLAGY